MLRTGVIALSACVAAGGSALAQERSEQGWRVSVGGGGLYAPSFTGDDEYRLSLLPNIELAYGDRFSASVQEGAKYRLISGSNLRAGPIARLDFGRDEDGEQSFAVTGEDATDLLGLGDVDASVELGGFVEYRIGPWAAELEARQAFSGHEGAVLDAELTWSTRTLVAGAPVRWSIGPRARVVSDDYAEAFFSIDAAQALASGLPQYEARGGLHSFGMGAAAFMSPTGHPNWAIAAIAGFDWLTDDTAESPLVRLRGSDEQARIGLFVSRRLF